VRRTKPIIGYLHTGMEKTAETLTFLQGPTNVTRMDYLAPFHNELCFSLAVERLLDIEVPERAQVMRILLTELNRISSHLVALATNGMDIGALSMMIYGFREREQILAFFEKTTGLRMNHNFIRPGGSPPTCRPAGARTCGRSSTRCPDASPSTTTCSQQPDLAGADPGGGVISAEECRLRHHRPHAARGRRRLGPSQGVPVLGDRDLRVRRAGGRARRCLRPLPVRVDEIRSR
jgi:NADH-quinone oxidoreductase subunit D